MAHVVVHAGLRRALSQRWLCGAKLPFHCLRWSFRCLRSLDSAFQLISLRCLLTAISLPYFRPAFHCAFTAFPLPFACVSTASASLNRRPWLRHCLSPVRPGCGRVHGRDDTQDVVHSDLWPLPRFCSTGMTSVRPVGAYSVGVNGLGFMRNLVIHHKNAHEHPSHPYSLPTEVIGAIMIVWKTARACRVDNHRILL